MQIVEKKKILMLCDHPLSTSGVATQSRWLIDGLLKTGKYSFRVFGGAVKHQSYETTVVTPDFIIKPTDGFGTPEMLRHALATERPDCLFLFTDPRFFLWIFQSCVDEVHQLCPIAYNHLWDNFPTPTFNKVIYDSTNLINCINWPTYQIIDELVEDKSKFNYVPHGVPADLYQRLPDTERIRLKSHILPGREDHYIFLFVGRNARRKNPSDIILGFKMFLDELEKKYGHKKATLLMHTDPMDQEGPNLIHVINALNVTNNVVFSKERVNFQEMNAIYNVCDTIINCSSAEGFGLPVLEAKMAELTVIAVKTGGLTRQVVDHESGVEFGVALEPEVKPLVGNQIVPFIYEDYCSHQTIANAYMKMYEMPLEQRKELGRKGREHSLKNYNLNDVINKWDETLTTLIDSWKANPQKNWRHVEL